MYFGLSLEMEVEFYEMVGVFDGVSKMIMWFWKFGYCIVEFLEDILFGKKGIVICGYEFYYFVFEMIELICMKLMKKWDGKIVKEWYGGY